MCLDYISRIFAVHIHTYTRAHMHNTHTTLCVYIYFDVTASAIYLPLIYCNKNTTRKSSTQQTKKKRNFWVTCIFGDRRVFTSGRWYLRGIRSNLCVYSKICLFFIIDIIRGKYKILSNVIVKDQSVVF